MKAEGPEAVFQMIRDATTRDRRIILGGMSRGLSLTAFEHLPLPTDKELSQWLVYSDLVTLKKKALRKVTRKYRKSIYVGSRTAGRAVRHGGARSGTYVHARGRMEAGFCITASNLKSFHLKRALRKEVDMNLRVLATFDPITTPLRDVLGAEGFYVDFFQSYSKDARPPSEYHSEQMLRASIDARPFDQSLGFDGLNRAHPFRQRVRTSASPAVRIFEQNDWICGVCQMDRTGKAVVMSHGLGRDDFPLAVCKRCARHAKKHPHETIEEIRRAREINTRVSGTREANQARRKEFVEHVQSNQCAASGDKDYKPEERNTLVKWDAYGRPCASKFLADCDGKFICQACEKV